MKKKHKTCHPLEIAKEARTNVRFRDMADAAERTAGVMEEEALERALMNGIDIGEVVFCAGVLYSTQTWVDNKQIYRITPELAEDLFRSDCSLDLTAINMPFPCVYFDFEDLDFAAHDSCGEVGKLKGCFVLIEPYDKSRPDGDSVCSVCPIAYEDGEYQYALFWGRFGPGKTCTLEELIKKAGREAPQLTGHIRNAVLCAAYISSAKPDVTEDPDHAPIYRKTREPYRYASVRKWDVGVRYMQEKRQYAERHESIGTGDAETSAEPRLRHSPRPHMRCAHWHTYLTGKGRKEKRILWIPPTAVGVHAENGDQELPAVVRTV